MMPSSLAGRIPSTAAIVLAASSLSFTSELVVADDLTVLCAAVEERLTSIRTLEVRYRSQTQATEHSPEGLITDEMSVNWCWSGGRELLRWKPPLGSMTPAFDWFYDGRRNVQFHYSRGKPHWIEIHPGAPPLTALDFADFPFYVGLRLHWAEGTLLDGLRAPSARLVQYADQLSLRVPSVQFQMPDREGKPVTFFVGFDSVTSGLPRRIEMRTSVGSDGGPVIVRKVFTIEDLIEVDDAHANVSLQFPRTVRVEAIWGERVDAVTRIEVDQLRLNRLIPESQFAAPQFPFGVQVAEFSGKAGELPRRYLAGGGEAVDTLLKQRQVQVRAELERLSADGVRFDSSPPARYGWTGWLLGLGIACLVSFGVVAIRRRRM